MFFKYLSYVLRHKWFVMIECFHYGLYWRGLKHDMSKLLPTEFFPYMRFFYGKYAKARRDSTGYYKPNDTGDANFDFAWFKHQKRNDHHWQWWILPTDGGGIKALMMPLDARKEMIADWRGAGRAQGNLGKNGEPEVLTWYTKNKDKLVLHPATREWVEREIGYTP